MTLLPTRLRQAALAALLAWASLAHAQQRGEDYPLDRDLPAEERAHLQRELHDYSEQAYPDRQRLQQRREEMRERLHRHMDARGGISRDEARQNAPWLERRFDRIDSNGDGVISADELRAARERHR